MLSSSELDFYQLFLDNSLKRERYRIRLHNGKTLEGIPSAGSILDPRDPEAMFFLDFNGTCKEILFRSVRTVERIGKGCEKNTIRGRTLNSDATCQPSLPHKTPHDEQSR